MNPFASTASSGSPSPAAQIAAVRILIVEDDQRLAAALVNSLEQQGYTIVGIAATGAIAIQQAIATRPDLVLVDLLLPGEIDSVAIAAKISQQIQCPILYLTAQVSSALSHLQAVTAPPQPHEPSGQLAKLGEFAGLDRAIESALQWSAAGTALQPTLTLSSTSPTQPFAPASLLCDSVSMLDWDMLQAEFFQQVCKLIRTEDLSPVTPLTPRASRSDRATPDPAPRPKVLRTNCLIPVLCLKLDLLHRIYRKWGQPVGDRVLQQLAERLTTAIGDEGRVAYLPPQEFVVLWKPVKSRGQIITAVRSLLQTIAQPLTIDQDSIAVTASLGVAFYPRDGQPLETLLDHGRHTVSHLQRQGGNRYEFYHPQHEPTPLLRSPLESEFAAALERRALYLHYQPRVAFSTGAVIGVEAGLCWHSAEQGEIAAATLLELATATGLLEPIGLWHLETACQQLHTWQSAGLPPLQMAVPLNSALLKQPNLAAQLTQLLQVTHVLPRSLELEIDAAQLGADQVLVLRQLRALDAIGVRLTIVQSGTSDALLKHLQQFPCHRLKLSAAFIRGVHCQAQKATIAANLIAWAHHHHRTVLAAGVATQGEFTCLKQLQCDAAQGDWFSGFLPEPQLLEFLNGSKSLPIAQ